MWTGSPFSCCAGRGLYSASAHAGPAVHRLTPAVATMLRTRNRFIASILGLRSGFGRRSQIVEPQHPPPFSPALSTGHDGNPHLLAQAVTELLLAVDDEQDEMLPRGEPFLDLHHDLAPRQLPGQEVGAPGFHLLGRVDLLALRVVLVAPEDLDRESLLRRIGPEVPDPELDGPGLMLLDHAGLDAPGGHGELDVSGGRSYRP